ncbi:FkbM family methyltransferase [Azospirillum sp. INR13]|uniref:FkbM family methyltransferase n=1 Tax=Azospirillum sp. INR13 TaxID=2596919 RepID=UPI00189213EC|nr:FkbM family methyltransferase [Azospirillum sp. INR13]
MGNGGDEVPALRHALRERLDQAVRTPGDWRMLQAEDRRDLDPGEVPLILLGAGSVMAQPLVRHALGHWKVVGVVDNARAGLPLGDGTILGDDGLRDLIRRDPRAVGVMCCNSDEAVAHFHALWQPSGRPLLSLFEAMRSAGLCPPGMMGTPGQIAALAEWEADWKGFDDDASRRCFLSVMLYRLTWDACWLEPVRLPYRDMYFFTDALAVGRDEVLVDGGAFDGDTVAAFAACSGGTTGGTHRHIHAFEADPSNLPRLRECVAALPRVTIHPIGLWSHADTLHFSSGHGPGGRLDEGGDVSVPVQALDDLGLGPVTFIKLDIEGAELPALRGAERTIRHHRPKLAIAVYHDIGDFAAIPRMIETMRPGSRYRLRHHSPIHHDTVLYVQ